MLTTILCASAVAFAVGGEQTLTAEQCQQRLAGSWEAHLSAKQSIVMKIVGERIMLFAVANGQEQPRWTAKLVISTTEPTRHMDWQRRTSINGPLPDNQCLYRLAGDTLLLIGGGPDRRPDRFFSGQGKEPKTLVFTRIPNQD